ncbi:MAG: DUF1501 domain-containing protein [Planctomycetaceae bacterium]|nr:DUF1501 domain-containing protein [Planctomycetaceae bacterium]
MSECAFRGSRRSLLQASGCGFGYLAFAGLSAEESRGAESSLTSLPPHHLPRAKRVIFLFMHGGPSHVDLFDYKPRLQADHGKPLPFKAPPNISAVPKLMKSPWEFSQHGQSGLWISELLPEVAKHVDDLCVIRSMHSRGQSHGQAVCMLHTGSDNFVRPSVGAWISYGLGTENQRLPAFVSISPPSGHGGPRNYGSAFLPASHQATTIGSSGKLGTVRIDNLDGEGPLESRRRQLDLLQSFNREHLARARKDDEIEGAIKSFELAFRMQETAPEVLDLSREPKSVLDLYGAGQKETDNFAKQCILARRMAEAGVRYVQVSTGNVWDQHGNLKDGHEKNCRAVDRPIAALLTDLKARGMLDDTLVVWGGEFGRTPIVQGSDGRDHNPQGFSMWMAGGGSKGGLAYGQTDEFGYFAVENRVHMHDLHATILHLMGLKHDRLTYRHAGRDFRLTDVAGHVVHDLIA